MGVPSVSSSDGTISSKIMKLRTLTDTKEVKTIKFWQAVAAEFIGTLVLMFVQAILPLGLGNPNEAGNVVRIGVGMAFVIICMASSLGPISGGHLNPAVTFSMLSVGKISIIKGLMYIIAQCVGAIAGAGIAFGVTPANKEDLSATLVNGALAGAGVGLVVEAMLGFILVLTISGNTDERNGPNPIAPIAIGFAVGLDILSAALYTGASINPARSLGPAVVLGASKYWENHWVYWIGPTVGGIVAALLYNCVLTYGKSKSDTLTITDDSSAEGNTLELRLKALESKTGSDNSAFN